MKIIKSAFALFILIIWFSSCQKEITSDIATQGDSASTSLRPKKYIEDVTASGHRVVTTYLLSYDVSGRITGIVDSATPGNKSVYQYNTNNSYTMDIYDSNKLSIHEVFFLNNIPSVDSSFQYDDTNDSMTEKYTYNSSKQLIMLEQFQYSASGGAVSFNTHNYTYDSTGNLTTDSNIFGATTYDYYPNLLNNLSAGQIYFYTNKNLVKTTSYTSGGITTTASHSYLFDSKNRQTGEKAVASNGDVVIKTYIY